MLFDDLLRAVAAQTAADAYGQCLLDVRERPRAAIHDLADLAISDCAADTDVHDEWQSR